MMRGRDGHDLSLEPIPIQNKVGESALHFNLEQFSPEPRYILGSSGLLFGNCSDRGEK